LCACKPYRLCSNRAANPSKYPEMLRKVQSSECCYLQAFCTHLKTPANLRGALAWRRPGVRVPSGALSFSVDSQVKREEQNKASACSRALVQQPSGTTSSYSQSQTAFPPNSQRVHALLACVRSCESLRRVRLRASTSCLGADLSVPCAIAIILTDEDELLVNTALGPASHIIQPVASLCGTTTSRVNFYS
jgi:hypothetical protein